MIIVVIEDCWPIQSPSRLQWLSLLWCPNTDDIVNNTIVWNNKQLASSSETNANHRLEEEEVVVLYAKQLFKIFVVYIKLLWKLPDTYWLHYCFRSGFKIDRNSFAILELGKAKGCWKAISFFYCLRSWSRCPTWLNLKIESKVTFDNAYCSIPSCCLVKAEEGAVAEQCWRNKVSTMLSRFSSPTKVWEKTTTSFVVKEGLIYPISTSLIILLSNLHFLSLWKRTHSWP